MCRNGVGSEVSLHSNVGIRFIARLGCRMEGEDSQSYDMVALVRHYNAIDEAMQGGSHRGRANAYFPFGGVCRVSNCLKCHR